MFQKIFHIATWPRVMMRWLVYHFASGDALFSGCVLLLLACALSSRIRNRQWMIRVLIFSGLAIIVASATPLPTWFYCCWFLVVTGWIIARWLSERERPLATWIAKWLCLLVAALTTVAMRSELRFLMAPTLSVGELSNMAVIGDSLSAADGERDRTWPQELMDAHGIRVVNFATPGATARSALKQAAQVTTPNSLVVIEIGGNDLLGGTFVGDFSADLETLLASLSDRSSHLVMLELPLPPLYNGYGRAQRRLAKRFDVHLIPKREFAGVVMSAGATVDGLHLSPAGHRRMADMIWRHIHTDENQISGE